MRAVDIITKKRDGEPLTRAEIDFFVFGFCRGDIPDYQAAAWAMAVQLNGMTPRETTDLTLAMVASGETLDFGDTVDFVVDKHSTGGVGDKTSLVVAPLVSACGLPVGKMSGRGLGFSGGTLDKLESFPGFRCDLSTEEFLTQLKRDSIVLTGQSADLAPADGKLYALRDVTGTVPSIPLIASSIMSKKIAAGAQAIVLDVKVGNGAFMTNLKDARELANLMVDIGRLAGSKTVALLSQMDEPLGLTVGNALEVREAIETLRGKGPEDFWLHCLEVAAHMLVLGRLAPDLAAAKRLCREELANGEALEQLRKLIHAQGGDTAPLEDLALLPDADWVQTFDSPQAGYLSQIHARSIGETAVFLGAGRAEKDAPIDYGVGIEIFHKVGDRVERGEPIFTVHAASQEMLDEAGRRIMAGYTWSAEPVDGLPLFYGVVE